MSYILRWGVVFFPFYMWNHLFKTNSSISKVTTSIKLSQYSKKCLDAALKWAPKSMLYPKRRRKCDCLYLFAALERELLDGRDVHLIHFYIVTLTDVLGKKRELLNKHLPREWADGFFRPHSMSRQLWNQSEVTRCSPLL